MSEQLKLWIEVQARQFGDAVARLATLIGHALLFAWDFIRPALVLALNVLAALILLFEEWGWRPLSNLVSQLARIPLWAKTELWIAGLPPYGALLALGVPSAILVPAKLVGVFLLATGHIVSATIVIVAAKLASTALIARIFLLTKPALMQIEWFARAYEIFVPWQEALFARVRASWVWRYGRIVKWRASNYLRASWRQFRPRLEAAWREVRPRMMQVREWLGHSVRALGGRIVSLRTSAPRRLPPRDVRR
jgi:hypothetical protein